MVDDDTLRALEHEMGVLSRRIRRVIAERARMLHEAAAEAPPAPDHDR